MTDDALWEEVRAYCDKMTPSGLTPAYGDAMMVATVEKI